MADTKAVWVEPRAMYPKSDIDQLITDHHVQSVEQSAKQPDPVTAAPPAEKPPVVRSFKRQLALWNSIRSEQEKCERQTGHDLASSKDSIMCLNCGALWVR